MLAVRGIITGGRPSSGRKSHTSTASVFPFDCELNCGSILYVSLEVEGVEQLLCSAFVCRFVVVARVVDLSTSHNKRKIVCVLCSCSGMGTQPNFGSLVSHCGSSSQSCQHNRGTTMDKCTTRPFCFGLAVASQRYPPTHGHTWRDALAPPIFLIEVFCIEPPPSPLVLVHLAVHAHSRRSLSLSLSLVHAALPPPPSPPLGCPARLHNAETVAEVPRVLCAAP